MRRRLTPVRLLVIHTSRRRGRTPVAIPAAPAAFSASLPSCPIVGLGRCQCFAPARFFAGELTGQLEVQDEL
jgi:hypothetical protein